MAEQSRREAVKEAVKKGRKGARQARRKVAEGRRKAASAARKVDSAAQRAEEKAEDVASGPTAQKVKATAKQALAGDREGGGGGGNGGLFGGGGGGGDPGLGARRGPPRRKTVDDDGDRQPTGIDAFEQSMFGGGPSGTRGPGPAAGGLDGPMVSGRGPSGPPSGPPGGGPDAVGPGGGAGPPRRQRSAAPRERAPGGEVREPGSIEDFEQEVVSGGLENELRDILDM